jgi:hypothetical protein
MLSLIDNFGSWILMWVPFYYLLKAAFLLYLMLPMTRGAEQVYSGIVAPVLRMYQPEIDGHIESVSDHISSAIRSTSEGSEVATSGWGEVKNVDAAVNRARRHAD